MTIERRLQLTAGVLILFVLVTTGILFWSSGQVEDGLKRIETTSQVVHSSFMLKALMDDYLHHGGKRPLRQWNRYHEDLGQILNHEKSMESVDPPLLEDLKQSYQVVTSISPQVIALGQDKGNEELPQVREMLTGLMSLRLEQLVNAAIDLNTATQTMRLKKRKFVQKLITGTSLAMVVIIMINIYLIGRSVVSPLKVLASGAERVREGNFDSIRDTKSDDEVGKLTRAFNRMIEGIRDRTAALKQAQEELESRVLDRTAELCSTNERLAVEIEERQRAEEAVKAERQRLYGVLETLPVYVCLLDSEYYMPFANRYFRKTFGESLGRRCHDFLFNRAEPCEICETYTVMRTGAPHHWYWTGPNARNYDIYDFPFTDADGSTLILEMGIDITDQKQAEDALKRTLADLTRSNADLEQFAYVASHDLQEPLRNVASCMQLLEKKYKGKLDTEADKLLWYAVDSVSRMKALILDLLAHSRISTRGRNVEPANCEEVLTQALRVLRASIEETDSVITHDPLPTVMADFTQLLQVVQNLIVNAMKFRGPEPPRIHVSAVRDGDEWVFSVKDNGIGIETRHLDRIFVIFQRLHKRSEYDGTGMGLAIVKKIVERHQGRIWVESEPGKGTTFYFTIPAQESTHSQDGKI